MATEEYQKIYDTDGTLLGVFIPARSWNRIESQIRKMPEASKTQKDDLAGFNELMQAWTFAYPYNPAVACPACGKETGDWQADPNHPFVLVSANIGGLLVFHCKNCGATIRHKYYRRHMALEHSV